MKKISFEELGKAPKSIIAMYIVSLLVVVAGVVLLVMNMLDLGNVTLSAALACIVASQFISLFALSKHRTQS